MRRVVITGIGLVTPLGSTTQSTWNGIINSKSGIKAIPSTMFDTSDLPTKIAGLVPQVNEENGLNPDDYIPGKEQKKMDKFIHFAIAAAHQAIKDSGWVVNTEEDRCNTGVFVGSGIGGLGTIEENALILKEKGPRRISPFFIPASLINLASGHISILHGFKGPNNAVVTACSTGAHAIADASRIIAMGEANVMIAGGAESPVTRLGVAGFNACRALSTAFNDNPTKASRPWDKDRDGFVMGEGAGVVVLEEYEHAKKRGANIYGELIGYGLSGDAYHITAPAEDGDGGYRAMQAAFKKAKINSDEVDYINAHGTSTPLGDMIELNAVKRAFANTLNKISISSTKSAIGHLLGAAGGVEAIFTLLAMKHSLLPPTLNLDNPEEGCNIDLVPQTAKEKTINIALSNSFGFGGTNISLIFKKV